MRSKTVSSLSFLRVAALAAAIPALLLACGKVEPRSAPASSASSISSKKEETSASKVNTAISIPKEVEDSESYRLAADFVLSPIVEGKEIASTDALDISDVKSENDNKGDLLSVKSKHGLGYGSKPGTKDVGPTDLRAYSTIAKLAKDYSVAQLQVLIDFYQFAIQPPEAGGMGMVSEIAFDNATEIVPAHSTDLARVVRAKHLWSVVNKIDHKKMDLPDLWSFVIHRSETKTSGTMTVEDIKKILKRDVTQEKEVP